MQLQKTGAGGVLVLWLFTFLLSPVIISVFIFISFISCCIVKCI